MYDWAVSAVQTTIMVAVFPVYFTSVVASGLPQGEPSQLLAYANSLETALVALLSPILGAAADDPAARKRMLAVFVLLGAIGATSMYLVQQGDVLLALALFVLVQVGAGASTVFYEALLPHLARPDELERTSTAGYAVGYLGGGLLLALNLLWIERPGLFGLPSKSTVPARLALSSVGLWWLVFSLPLLLGVREPRRLLEADETERESVLRVAVTRLRETLRGLRQHRQAFLMLLAFLVYNDGIGTIQRLAAAYGGELGIGRGALIGAILLVQFVGIPCSFLFGAVASRVGTKPAILFGLAVFVAISVLGYFMRTATHFFVLALLVGMVQGGTQALSRALFARMIPRHKSGEFFGFYSVFAKFAGIFGPLLFAGAIEASGSLRAGILSVVLFFIAGGALLAFVDVEAGERAAREADRETRAAP